MTDSKKRKYFDEMKQRKEEKDWINKFTSGQGYCLACGHDYLLDLEYHHVEVKANSNLTASLCRNCHGRLSRSQMKSWPDGWNLENKPKKVKTAMLLREVSDCLYWLADI